jgi:DNA polymerase-3 subunit delta'
LLWVEPTYKHKNELLTVTEAIAAGVQRKSPPQIRLEQVRAIAAFAARLPVEAPRSTIAIDGAETLAEAAANALLKTLEEPGQSRIILIASDPAALLSTIVSRCQLVPFRRLSTQQVTDIVSSQQELHGLPPHLLALAQGSPGLALEAIARFRALPPELAEQLQTWPTTVRGSLELGRSIARDLDVPAQLWLIDYLQQLVSQQGEFRYIPKLERARQQLLAFVQPQLVWEIALTP